MPLGKGSIFSKYVRKSLQAPSPVPHPSASESASRWHWKLWGVLWERNLVDFDQQRISQAYMSARLLPRPPLNPLYHFLSRCSSERAGTCNLEQSWMCLWSLCDGVKSVLCTCLLDRSTLHLHLWKPGYGSSVAGNLRTSPFLGHNRCRASTPRFHSTAWGRQNKASEQWFQPDTTLYLKIPNEGDFPGSFPKRWYLMCLLHQRFLSDVLPVRCGRLGQ